MLSKDIFVPLPICIDQTRRALVIGLPCMLRRVTNCRCYYYYYYYYYLLPQVQKSVQQFPVDYARAFRCGCALT